MANIDERAQDLAEALHAVLEGVADLGIVARGDLAEALERAERLLASLTYDKAGSASSQNYIDTGVRLLAPVEDDFALVPPEVIASVTTLEPDDVREWLLTCPHADCTSHEFYEVDRAERWNPLELVDGPALTLGVYEGSTSGDGYQFAGYLCQADPVNHPVSLPDFVKTEWVG